MLFRLLEKLTVNRLVKTGLAWGDWESYALTTDKNPYDKRLAKWEARYGTFSYERVPRQVWIHAGGYGCSYKEYLRKPLP